MLVKALAAFLDPDIGLGGGKMGGGIEQQRPARGVRRDRQLIGIRHGGDLARLRHAPTPGDVEHRVFGGAGFKQLLEGHLAAHALARDQGHRGGGRHFMILLEIARHQHVLQPHRLIGLQRVRDADGGRHIPLGVEFDGDLDLFSKRVAQLLDRGDRLVDLVPGDELVLVVGREPVERPDLDALDAAGIDQLAHDLFRLGVEIVFVGEAGVVEPDTGIGAPANEAIDRRIERFPEQVPQRQVDGAQRTQFRAAGHLEIEGAVKVGPDALDVARVAAEQRGCCGMDDVGFRRLARIGFANAVNAGVGLDLDPGPVRPEFRILTRIPVEVSMRVIFIGGASAAACAYWTASGEASSEDSIRRRSSMRFPRTRLFYLGRSCGMGQGGSTAGTLGLVR